MDWKEANVHFGLILTGAKLVDNVVYRDQLKQFEPEAIGGEMEGVGLYATCQDEGVDWILVKAICDWADGNKDAGKAAHQQLAAYNAARFVLHALKYASLKQEREHVSSSEPSPLKPAKMHFISKLCERLVEEKEVHDLSRNTEFSSFEFIGFKETRTTLDFAAFTNAEALTETQIVSLRNDFFQITQKVPREFGLRPHLRNPNGLLGFIFKDGCPTHIVDFIKKQTRISHSASKSAIIVSWTIDVKNKQIHTHRCLVSPFPPVILLATTVFPGLSYLQSFLQNYAENDPSSSQ